MNSKENIVFLGMMGSGKSSIGSLISKELNLNFFDTIEPIELFPEPIIPIKTKFSFDFISFFIEKTQICLNLKLIKSICNLLEKQVIAKV